ncbi:MAG: DUF4276 family protein [Chloroflexota bacterium]
MKFVQVLVEGQTENEFVDVLNDYFQVKNIYLTPVIAKTKRPAKGNPAYRGGIVSFGKVEFDLQRMLQDSSTSLVTTMIDFYRLPTDFPSYHDEKAEQGSLSDRVAFLEEQFAKIINHSKFLPYFSIHEFEALLFTDTEKIVQEVVGENSKIAQKLQKISEQYTNPEEINLQDPPSKRILKLLKSYDKVAHGYGIAIDIGVEAMRKSCPHFNQWLTKIESI